MKTAILAALLAAVLACGGTDSAFAHGTTQTAADVPYPGERVQTQVAPNVVDCELSGPFKGCWVSLSIAEPLRDDPAIPITTYFATVEVVRTEGTPIPASLGPFSIVTFSRGVAFGAGEPPGQHGLVTYRLTVSGLTNGGSLVAQ